jgi:hypothetical protein
VDEQRFTWRRHWPRQFGNRAACRRCRAIAGTLGGDVSARSISLGFAGLAARSTRPPGAFSLQILVATTTKIVRASAHTLSRCSVNQDLAEIAFTCHQISWPLQFQHNRHTYNKSR